MPPHLFSPSLGLGLLSLFLGLLAAYLRSSEEFNFTAITSYGLLNSSPRAPIVYDAAQRINYVGTSKLGVEHFQNIFYAETTSGVRRFAPPVRLKLSPGAVIDSTAPGAWCPQGVGDVLPFTSKVTNVSENCLSLRIARPQGINSNAKLPVVVYLHGGGHALGSAYEVLYEPDGMVKQAAADKQPVIFVGVNYRLGIFGFATSKALVEAKHTNVGLRDQRAALEWVRDNIEIFGGDPNNVTAIGQSVGASDISLHLTSFNGASDVPFSKAIMMSGAPGLNFNTVSDLVANNTAAIAAQLGCIKDYDSQSAATLDCLRRAPFDQLMNLSVSASRAARPPFGEGFFFPTYDGDFLPGRPSELMRAGKFVKNVPIIASWVTNDGAWYAPPTTSTDAEVLATFSLWLHNLSNATKAHLLDLYPLADFEHMVRPGRDGPISPQYYRAAQINRDLWFTCPVLDFAWQYTRHGGASLWVSEHNATRFGAAYESMGVPMWRASHLSDIPYVLNNRHLGDASASQLELSKRICRSIVCFANSGDPEGCEGGVKAWPPAFQDVSKEVFRAEFPNLLNLELFGGPYGTVPVTVARSDDGDQSGAERAVAWERLFERCDFVNSHVVREETGV